MEDDFSNNDISRDLKLLLQKAPKRSAANPPWALFRALTQQELMETQTHSHFILPTFQKRA